MVVFVLYLKANLENVASIRLPEYYEYCIDVKNSTGEDLREGVRVTAANTEELKDSRGTANFTIKWVKDARKASYLSVLPIIKNLTRAIGPDDSNKWVPIVGFDCRGLDVTNFHPEDGFRVESTGGTMYDDVDLSQGDWVEYDDNIDESVCIYDLEHKIEPYH